MLLGDYSIKVHPILDSIPNNFDHLVQMLLRLRPASHSEYLYQGCTPISGSFEESFGQKLYHSWRKEAFMLLNGVQYWRCLKEVLQQCVQVCWTALKSNTRITISEEPKRERNVRHVTMFHQCK